MKEFEVECTRTRILKSRVFITVEAQSEDQALELAKEQARTYPDQLPYPEELDVTWEDISETETIHVELT